MINSILIPLAYYISVNPHSVKEYAKETSDIGVRKIFISYDIDSIDSKINFLFQHQAEDKAAGNIFLEVIIDYKHKTIYFNYDSLKIFASDTLSQNQIDQIYGDLREGLDLIKSAYKPDWCDSPLEDKLKNIFSPQDLEKFMSLFNKEIAVNKTRIMPDSLNQVISFPFEDSQNIWWFCKAISNTLAHIANMENDIGHIFQDNPRSKPYNPFYPLDPLPFDDEYNYILAEGLFMNMNEEKLNELKYAENIKKIRFRRFYDETEKYDFKTKFIYPYYDPIMHLVYLAGICDQILASSHIGKIDSKKLWTLNFPKDRIGYDFQNISSMLKDLNFDDDIIRKYEKALHEISSIKYPFLSHCDVKPQNIEWYRGLIPGWFDYGLANKSHGRTFIDIIALDYKRIGINDIKSLDDLNHFMRYKVGYYAMAYNAFRRMEAEDLGTEPYELPKQLAYLLVAELFRLGTASYRVHSEKGIITPRGINRYNVGHLMQAQKIAKLIN